jgi:hypothetical protein
MRIKECVWKKQMTHDYLRQPNMMQLKEEDTIGQKCEEAALSVSGFGTGKSLV